MQNMLNMFNIRRLFRRLARLPAPARTLSLLLASLAAGLIPPALLLLASLGWYMLPNPPDLNITWLTCAALLAAPFIAGYANCRWRRAYTLAAGAFPALLLWGTAFAAYWRLFGLPAELQRAAFSLLAALLMGIAGSMTAAKR